MAKIRHRWVCCTSGKGYRYEVDDDVPSSRLRHFPRNSMGIVQEVSSSDHAKVWIISLSELWNINNEEIIDVDVEKTGDKYNWKICNRCHRLLSVNEFDRNQTNLHGVLRRPSCRWCRADIDRRAPKSQQAKKMERRRPMIGDPFRCPICHKSSIVGITAKIVADHDHHTGNIRDFICDSCNTGLGRFKNGQDCLRDALQYLAERQDLK